MFPRRRRFEIVGVFPFFLLDAVGLGWLGLSEHAGAKRLRAQATGSAHGSLFVVAHHGALEPARASYFLEGSVKTARR